MPSVTPPDEGASDELADLRDRVERLERLLRKQADYHAELMTFVSPTAPSPEDSEVLMSIAEAAAYLTIGQSTFKKRRKELGLKPAVMVRGRYPRYSKADIERAREKL